MEPIKDVSCDTVLGAFRDSIGSVFPIRGVIPVQVILCSNHSHFFRANWHLISLSDIFSRFNFRKIFSTAKICSISVPLVTTKMSSMNACACGNSERIVSITLWNSAGMVVRP